MMRMVISAAVFLFLSGCVAPQVDPGPYERRQEFSESKHEPYSLEGTGSISGQTFLRTVGGDVKVGAGSRVSLVPATQYFWENMQAFLQDRPISNTDPRASELIRTKVSDGEGRFSFESIPAGRYYLMSSVYWRAPTGYRYKLERHGSQIVKVVNLKKGESLSVSLTK